MQYATRDEAVAGFLAGEISRNKINKLCKDHGWALIPRPVATQSTLLAEEEPELTEAQVHQLIIEEDERKQRADRENEIVEWRDATERKIEQAAICLGWEIDRYSYSGASHYVYISRGDRSLKIRISDHSDAYCTADHSIVFGPLGESGGGYVDNDTTLDAILADLR